MLLGEGSMRVTMTEMRGINYVTFSFFEGGDLVFDHIGKLIENSFETTSADKITNGFSVDSGIAIEKYLSYTVAVINRFGKGYR